ncbi:hypothetical protein BDW71DRAFT_176889 [Aspergillus fruticulosus]
MGRIGVMQMPLGGKVQPPFSPHSLPLFPSPLPPSASLSVSLLVWLYLLSSCYLFLTTSPIDSDALIEPPVCRLPVPNRFGKLAVCTQRYYIQQTSTLPSAI